MNMSDED
jgi:Ca2+-binding EF-hand superfamily protein